MTRIPNQKIRLIRYAHFIITQPCDRSNGQILKHFKLKSKLKHVKTNNKTRKKEPPHKHTDAEPWSHKKEEWLPDM